MIRRSPSNRNPRGFSYIGLLILIAIMGVALAATGDLWQTESQREKEAQLLFVGHQFRDAIKRYCQVTPGRLLRYPMTLDDLLLDPRSPSPRRYLRRIYNDPITGGTDWGLVQGPSGEILGVYSKSEEKPLKQANFIVADATFEGRSKYSEWQFVFLGSAQSQALPTQPNPPGQPKQPQQPNQRMSPMQPFQFGPTATVKP